MSCWQPTNLDNRLTEPKRNQGGSKYRSRCRTVRGASAISILLLQRSSRMHSFVVSRIHGRDGLPLPRSRCQTAPSQTPTCMEVDARFTDGLVTFTDQTLRHSAQAPAFTSPHMAVSVHRRLQAYRTVKSPSPVLRQEPHRCNTAGRILYIKDMEHNDVSGRSFQFHVAIDFGTWGSGFGYNVRADGDTIKMFEHWPGQRGPVTYKTRSVLLYNLEDLSGPAACGWEAVEQYKQLSDEDQPNHLLLVSFKRYLMPEEFTDLPPLPPGLTAGKLVADFLAHMHKVVNSTLEGQYGRRYHPSLVRWCLTVPAALSERAKGTMCEAALEAGLIPTLHSRALLLAIEPEAAALTGRQHHELLGLGVASTFMVVDMGGGTVDLTLHRVGPVLGEGMELSEVTHREGLAEGATRVDERFSTHLQDLFGAEVFRSWERDNPEDALDLMQSDWEACKCGFGSCINSTTADVKVQLPLSLVDVAAGDLANQLQCSGNKLTLLGQLMRELFDPSLTAIINWAQDMLARAGGAHAVVLVGGFSGSPYARQVLRQALAKSGREVVAPMYGPTAVLEGAVWYARYPASIAARCSNMTYGIRTAVRPGPDAPSKKWIPERQAYRCLDGFTRYVSIGEMVKTGASVSHGFVPLLPNQTGANFDIYGSLKKGARYTTEQTMHCITTLCLPIPPGACPNPDMYPLRANFYFGEAELAVTVTDEQTNEEKRVQLKFDTSELSREELLSSCIY